MAKYLTVNSTFRPFSYQELLQPALMATEAHYQQEEALSALESEAAVWEKLGQNPVDRAEYNVYKQYMKDIESKRDELLKNGLNSSTRRNFMNLKRDYGEKIAPIAEAYNRREQDIKRQQEISDKTGGRTLYTRDASTTSLRDYMNGVKDFSQVNLDTLLNESMLGAKNISSRYFNTEEGKAFEGKYYTLITQQGLTPGQAIEVLSKSNKYPEFNKFIDSLASKTGISNYNRNDQSMIMNTILQGVNMGIVGATNEQIVRNRFEEERLSLAREQFDWQKEKWEDEQLGMKLPNGNRVKTVGGGRVMITYPDGKVEIKTASTSSNSSSSKSKKTKPFSGLQFKMRNDNSTTLDFQEGLSNKWSYKKSGFSSSDEKLVKASDLNSSMLTNIQAKLAEYGLTLDDVEIWVDRDWVTDNHYQIRPKRDLEQVAEDTLIDNLEDDTFGEL